MRIAQIAPIIERVPPKKYGGTERVVHSLTEELVKRGHAVTLFASGDSITSAKLVSVYPKALREAKEKNIYGPNIFTTLNIGLAYSMQNEFDIIHDHTGHLSLPVANISTTPVVMTLHGAFDGDAERIFAILKNPLLVSISKSQASTAPNLNYVGNVYNGLNMSNYPFSKTDDGYLLFVGRICHDKGTHLAIEIAEELGLPLIIAAKLEEYNLTYFNEFIAPHLSNQIRWVGEVNETERNRLMSRALCLLHTITWKEPFGLTMIESLACGCPVIATNLGSVPEIITDKIGFVIEDIEEAVKAVKNIHRIDRSFCRRYALENFSAAKMAQGYEKIYHQTIFRQKGKSFIKTVLERDASCSRPDSFPL